MSYDSSYLKSCLNRPIAFHRIFAELAGSVTAGLMLSQAWYWSQNKTVEQRDGWFWKTQAEWEEETSLSRYEQESARKQLIKRGFMEEDRKGVPARLFFRLNIERIDEGIRVLSRLRENHNLECGKPADWIGENQQTNTETTQRLLPVSSPTPRGKKKPLTEEEKKRFAPCQDILRRYMVVVRHDANAQATPRDYAVLSALIRNDRDMNEVVLKECLQNRIDSENVNLGDPLASFLMNVRRWEFGPLNQYGRVKNAAAG